MAAADDILRIFREFNRYTGDGKPGAPINAPLPVGDPQSGAHHPKKAELRAVLAGLVTDLEEGVDAVRDTLIEFRSRYLGAYDADPTADPEGNPLIIGALYFNTAEEVFRVWTGAAWRDLVAGSGSGGLAEVATRAALKAVSVNSRSVVFLNESGREGLFVLRTGSPPVTDTQEGVYVVSGTSGYYWERASGRLPTVRAFGAILDGTTNDSAAIQGAINVLGIAIIPYTATGFVAGGIDINPALGHIIRSEKRPVWKLPASATHAIRVLPASVAQSYAYIDDFVFDGAAAPATSGAILMNTSAGVVSGLRCKGLVVKDCGFAYKEEDSASNFVVDVEFGDVLCIFPRGRQIYSRRSRGFFKWNNIKVDNTYNVVGGRPRVTWNSVYFGDVLGLDFNELDVVGEVPGGTNNLSYQAGAIAVVIDGLVGGRGSIYGRRLLVDNTCGPAIQIRNAFNVEIDLMQAYANLGVAVELNTVSKSTFSKVKTFGGKGLANASAEASGLAMIACSLVTVSVLESENNTGSGSLHPGRLLEQQHHLRLLRRQHRQPQQTGGSDSHRERGRLPVPGQGVPRYLQLASQ
jgi:hypothetical protein